MMSVLYWYFLSVAIYVQFCKLIWFVAMVELILFPLHVCFLWRIIFRHITSAIARLYSHAPTFDEYLTKGCYYWVHQRVTSILWRMLKNSQLSCRWNPPLLYLKLVWHTFVFFNKNMAIVTCMIGGTKYICLWFWGFENRTFLCLWRFWILNFSGGLATNILTCTCALEWGS